MIKPVKRIIGAAILFGLLMSCEMAHAETADSSHINRSLLFNFGDNGSKFYRIPAIVTLSDGTHLCQGLFGMHSLYSVSHNISVP